MATKLEILKSYTPLYVKATWEILGKQEITPTTKFYSKDILYRINIPGESTLNGSMVFCTQDCMEVQDWLNAELCDYNFGYITFGNDIISPNFRLVCTHQEIENSIGSVPESFVPFKDYLQKTGVVQIDEMDYQTCLKVLGFPYITEDELEYSKEEILNLAIKPALEEYFHWLPNVKIETHSITGKIQEIQFPMDAYDVVNISLQQKGSIGAGNVSNSILRYFDMASYSAYNFSGLTGNYRGITAPTTNLSSPESFLSSRQLTQAFTNLNTRFHFDKYTKEDGTKWIKLYSNKLGNVDIHWALKSLNFNDVEFAQRQNLIKYCQGEIMELFANLRQQAKSDVTGYYDYSTWLSNAKTMKDDVRTEWKNLVKVSSIMRGSL